MLKNYKYLITVLIAISTFSCQSIKIEKYLKITESDFSMFGVNAFRTNALDLNLEPSFQKVWEYDADAGFSKYSACVADSILFLPTLYGELHLINIYSGKKIAKKKFGNPISGSILIQNNEVFITFSNSKTSLICYELTSGNIKWKTEIGEIETAPVVFGKKLFVSTLEGKLVSIDKSSGVINWIFNPDNKFLKASYSSPATDGKFVFYGCDDGYLYAIDFDNGKLKWKFKTNGSIKSNPTLNLKSIFFGSNDGNFYCLDINTGELIWKKEFGVTINNSQAVSDSFVYISTPDGYIWCLDIFSGKEIWKFYSGSLFSYSPLLLKNYLITGAYNKNVYMIDSRTGKLVWSYQLNGRVKSSPIVWREFIIFLTDNRYVYAFK